jgi:hypothetical protein
VASISVGPLIDLTKGKKSSLLLGLSLVIAVRSGWLPSAGRDYTTGARSAWPILGLGGGIIVTGAMALASDVSTTRAAPP